MLEIGSTRFLGLYMKIAPYVLLKRNNLGDFAKFNEMFGMPLRWYEYDPHDPVSRNEVTKQAEAYGSAAYVLVPKGVTVKFLEANKKGSSKTFSMLHDILSHEITVGVLGQTLTTHSPGSSSNALGLVHYQVEEELAQEDRLLAELIMNHSLRRNILIPHGYPLLQSRGSFKLSEEMSVERKFEAWLALLDKGLPISEEDFYEEFGVPFPGSRPVVISAQRKPRRNGK